MRRLNLKLTLFICFAGLTILPSAGVLYWFGPADVELQTSALLIAVAAALGLSWILAAFITNPLRLVVGQANEIIRGENPESLRNAVEQGSGFLPQELAELVDAYDQLVSEVEKHQSELEHRVNERTLELVNEITERQSAQLKLQDQQAQLAHVTRLSTMAEMATSFAHELNQPLAAISAYVDGSINRLQSGEAPTDGVINALEKASEQAVRAGQVIRRIREFIQNAEQERQVININDIVRDAVDMLEAEAKSNQVTVETILSDQGANVHVDPIQIQQALLNLGRNGIQAMAHLPEIQPRDLTVKTIIEPEKKVTILIQDTGHGLAADIREKMFDPFFTTKENGLGMGLPISRTIAEVHQGVLLYETENDKGTIFKITLPALEDTKA